MTLSAPLPKKKRKSPAGAPTSDLVLSLTVGTNADLFPQALSLYAAPGAKIADTTYGKGVFWRHVDPARYQLLATDLLTGTDARKLPYDAGSLDAVVFDPPYMRANGADGDGAYEEGEAHAGFRDHYQANRGPHADVADAPVSGEPVAKWHAATVQLYVEAAIEALRVLRPEGIYFVKCQDEVCGGRQCLTHVELINDFAARGFVCEDIFVLGREGRPAVSRQIRQLHARKAHSYLLVLRKTARKVWTGP